MKNFESIQSPTELRPPRIVLYPELSQNLYWLALFEELTIDNFYRYHINNLRSLSLYFDHILIPPGYFFTHFNTVQRLSFEKLICSDDFSALVSQNIIITCDDREQDRRSNLDFLNSLFERVRWPSLEKGLIGKRSKVFEKTSGIVRANIDQSISHSSQLRSQIYAHFHGIRQIYDPLVNHLNDSFAENTGEYMNEIFLCKLLNSEIPLETRRKAVRMSLDSFLLSQMHTINNLYVYGNPRHLGAHGSSLVLDRSLAHAELDIIREALSPRFFLFFLADMIGKTCARKILTCDIRKFLDVRDDPSWKTFAELYHIFVRNLNFVILKKIDFEAIETLGTNIEKEVFEEAIKDFSRQEWAVRSVKAAKNYLERFISAFSLGTYNLAKDVFGWSIDDGSRILGRQLSNPRMIKFFLRVQARICV